MICGSRRISAQFFQVPVIIFVIFTFIIMGCANVKPLPRELQDLSGYVPADHLVFIGLDGWGGHYVPKAQMPTVKRMMEQGASSLDVRCVMPSNSLPNWTAIFCGTDNIQNTEQAFSIFSLVKNERPDKSSVFFYEWTELKNICPDEAVEKFEIRSDRESAVKIAAYIKENKPVFTAVVFNEPDSTGHNKRWGSSAYYDKLTELDNYIAIIEQAIKDAGIYNNTVFVLSSDHGGTLWGHGFNTAKQRRIPLVIYGRGIKTGYSIPGQKSIYDIAPTMAMILGLTIPAEWTGQRQWEILNGEK